MGRSGRAEQLRRSLHRAANEARPFETPGWPSFSLRVVRGIVNVRGCVDKAHQRGLSHCGAPERKTLEPSEMRDGAVQNARLRRSAFLELAVFVLPLLFGRNGLDGVPVLGNLVALNPKQVVKSGVSTSERALADNEHEVAFA